MPILFVALHVFTLIRYDMLAANVRQLSADLAPMVPFEADREQCRQLLANVEFIQGLTAPPGSAL
jgi:cell division protein FtsB